MGQIPTFARTVMPDRSVGMASSEVARAAPEMRAQAAMKGVDAVGAATDMKLRYDTMEAQANNASWVNAQATEYRKHLYDNMDTLRKQREGNPQNFHKDFEEQMGKETGRFMETAPSDAARGQLEETMRDMRGGFYASNIEWERGRNLSIFGERMDQTADNLRTIAYRRGQAGEALEDSGIDGDIEASVVTGAAVVAPEKLGNIRSTMKKGVASEYFAGLAQADPLRAKELLKSGKYDDALGADGIQAAEGIIEQEEKKAQAKVKSELQVDIREVEKAAQLGLSMPPEKVDSMIARAAGVGLDEEAKALREYAVLQPKVETFAKAPLTAQQDELVALKRTIEETGNTDLVAEYDAKNTVLQNKGKMLQSDPWGWYTAQEMVPEPAPLEFGDPSALGHEFSNRRAAAQMVGEQDGVRLPLFTKPETERLKTMLSDADPQESGALLSTLGAALEPQEMGALARQVASDGKSSALAAVIANGDPLVSERMLQGMRLKAPSDTYNDFYAALNERIAGVVSDPAAFESAKAGIWNYYKQQAFANGTDAAAFDEDILDGSIQDVMGPVAAVGFGADSRILSYRDQATGQWRSEDELDDMFDRMDDAALTQVAGALPVSPNGLRWDVKTLNDQARIVSAGEGVYAFLDADGNYVADEQGRPVRVDARMLERYQAGVK